MRLSSSSMRRARDTVAPCILPALIVWSVALGGGAAHVPTEQAGGVLLLPAALAQGGNDDGNRIVITPDKPCFLNKTAPHALMKNCAPDGDWIGFALGPWEYVTGGNLSMAVAGILILTSWAKYRSAIYPMFVGVVMFPMSYFLFPESFLTFGLLMMGIGIGIFFWWAITRQTE